jgi:peptide/nickel transport system ATP-binding protein
VQALLASVQLPGAFARRLPRQLSGGERQRVGIARALAVNPQVLICDEPIASLDLSIGAAVLELLRDLSQQRQMSVLFISHDLRAVAWLCQRVMVMAQGRVIEAGDMQAVLGHPQEPYTQELLRAARLEL